jgi:hypothetical protein
MDVRAVVPLRPELLTITGAVSNPRARTIEALARPRLPLGATLLLLLVLSTVAWGVVYMAIWVLACLWRGGWLLAANLFLVLVAISLGAGIAWAGVTITEAALMRWVVTG